METLGPVLVLPAFRWVGMFELPGLEIPRLKYPAALRVFFLVFFFFPRLLARNLITEN